MKRTLEGNGYFAVKSGGSKGPVDVVGIKPGEIVLVQCKVSGRIDPGERVALWQVAARIGATPLVAAWLKEGRAARRVAFRRLTGTGAYEEWSPDYAVGAET